jgi:RNA polymerase sigma-70 factor (ECF subfamily)
MNDRDIPLDRTAELLTRIRAGDDRARDLLVQRHLPRLRRWAHGRLPLRARDLGDTEDLVQNTLIRALTHVKAFESRREGAFLAYLRRILLNQMRDAIRRVDRRGEREELSDSLRDPALVSNQVGADTLWSYEQALSHLPEVQQQAVVLRVEFHYSWEEVAEAIASPSANAARMMVSRALLQLADLMQDEPDVEGA